MTASFWGVNLNGTFGLLSGVFRCCSEGGRAGGLCQPSVLPSGLLGLPMTLGGGGGILCTGIGRRAWWCQATGSSGELTTMSESLGLEAVMEKARVCGLAAVLAERAAVRNSSGAILVAMTGDYVDSIAT